MNRAGYRTAMAGKWHVGDNVSPVARGFGNFYGFTRGYAVDSWEPRMMTRLPEGRPCRTYEKGRFFATDAITDHALDFLAGMRQADAPWFLYVAYQTPHFVHWPAGTKRKGQIDHRPGHLIDVMATCAEAAGATYPKSIDGQAILPMEGRSLLPALRGDPPQPRTLFWEHEGNRAVRDGRWKLAAVRDGPWTLYDIDADRTEQNDLAERHPDVVARLAKAWNQWAQRCWVRR